MDRSTLVHALGSDCFNTCKPDPQDASCPNSNCWVVSCRRFVVPQRIRVSVVEILTQLGPSLVLLMTKAAILGPKALKIDHSCQMKRATTRLQNLSRNRKENEGGKGKKTRRLQETVLMVCLSCDLGLGAAIPNTFAVNCRPSVSVHTTLSALATTWALVTMIPDWLIITPDPNPLICSRKTVTEAKLFLQTISGTKL